MGVTAGRWFGHRPEKQACALSALRWGDRGEAPCRAMQTVADPSGRSSAVLKPCLGVAVQQLSSLPESRGKITALTKHVK